jgi:putative iron-only hydrogenase system regulator
MKRIAIIGAVLENPNQCYHLFNETVARFRGIVKCRTGMPFETEGITVISITVMGELNEINALTGRLGSLPNVRVRTAVTNANVENTAGISDDDYQHPCHR